jgi:hypothetical protein
LGEGGQRTGWSSQARDAHPGSEFPHFAVGDILRLGQ